MVEIGPDTAAAYLRGRGSLPEGVTPTVRSLGGGVSNNVVSVVWDDRCLVLKQPLPNLAVEDDWPADIERVHNEAEAARAYGSVIDAAGLTAVRVPGVRFEDRDNHVIAIDCAPTGAGMWKRDLLDGRVDVSVARSVGRVLGAVHRRMADDDDVRSAFASKRPFEQLRIDPYHRTTADRHPDVAEPIRAEVERIMSIDRTLVHGDYSPKNVLLEDTDRGPVVWILDFEVAHWGDPAFDVAFMLNHLFIKSVYNHEQSGAYVDAARAFYNTHIDHVPWTIERETIAELAILMLARIDGKSPVEYIDEGPMAEALRRIAKRVLTSAIDTLDDFVRIADEERQQL